MDAREIEKRFGGLLKPILDENGLSLLKTEYVKESGNYYLRGFIDKEDGEVSIDDCTLVSRIVSKKLDQADFIPEAYTMEICSPGFLRKAEEEPNQENGGEES